jgi:hypothetical protein
MLTFLANGFGQRSMRPKKRLSYRRQERRPTTKDESRMEKAKLTLTLRFDNCHGKKPSSLVRAIATKSVW